MNIFRTITNRLRLFACAAGLAALCSCEQDVFRSPILPVESIDGQISVLYEVEGDIPLTRGIAALDHEKSLKQVHILFFDHSDNDSYAGCAMAPASSGGSTIKFDPPETVLPGTQYRLLVVGNGKDHDGGNGYFSACLESLQASDTYTDVRGRLMAYADESVVDPANLPLCGRFVDPSTDNELYFKYTRTEEGLEFPYGEGKSIFRFQRAICRVDVHNLVANTLDIRFVRLVNTKTAGYYFFDGLNTDSYHELRFVDDHKSPGFVELPALEAEGQLQRLEAKLYCYPNTVNTCLPDDEKTTAVMIPGYYTDPESGVKDDVLTYYRFNISNAGEAQTLQRNYCYRASIKGVKRRGQLTELDAFKEKSPVFVYDIGEEWNTDDDNVVTDEYGNFLVVSKSLLTFTGDQSGADVVKLTVNTSDGMEWKIEMDDESKKYFQAQPIAAAPGERIQAFTCGPKQTNYSDYYYEGSLWIVATNKNTGRELRKEVRLVQLTTSGDVKCLVVNDYTSSFAQEVSKYGQTISYKVITGNPTNKWTATDVNSTLNGWSDNVTFTESGTNGNFFTITFPANIGEKRSVDIKFEFDCGDAEENAKIKPITVTFTQNFCEQPLVIEGWPADGELTLNCFDTNTGWEYANCVAQSRKFTVHLQRPDEHYFTVESSFDEHRDLSLNFYDGRYGMGHEITSIHPGLYYLESNGSPYIDNVNSETSKNYNKILPQMTEDAPSFYVNAFRMGPGDVTIQGTITVEVLNKADDQPVANGKLILSVNLTVPSDEYEINDVMIKNDVTQRNSNGVYTEQDNGWIYIMDRNIGCEPRMHTDENDNIYPNRAMWCYLEDGEYTKEWKITNMTNNQKWLGFLPLEFPFGINHGAAYTPEKLQSWKNELKSHFSHLGKMYQNADEYPWQVFSDFSMPAIRKNMAISKGRYFILSDPEVCPVNSRGKLKRIACWLPFGCRIGYGNLGPHTNFGDNTTILNCKSILDHNSYWYNGKGCTGFVGASGSPQLTRLIYLIGYTSQSSSAATSLSSSLIKDELDYYKNHILKCYDAQ